MDPHVYPDAVNAPPLSLDSLVTSSPESIEQLTSTVGSINGDNFMYIRLAMSDPIGALSSARPMPDVILQAGAGPASTPLTFRSLAIFDGPTYVADGSILQDPTYINVWVISLDFNPATFGLHTWTITIKNNDGVARDFTWVVSGTEANTAQPWIDVEPAPPVIDPMRPTTLVWDVLINGSKGE